MEKKLTEKAQTTKLPLTTAFCFLSCCSDLRLYKNQLRVDGYEVICQTRLNCPKEFLPRQVVAVWLKDTTQAQSDKINIVLILCFKKDTHFKYSHMSQQYTAGFKINFYFQS